MLPSFARVALVALFARATFAQQNQTTVEWTSPAKGDNYVAGDTTTIKWKTSQILTGPTLLLCYSSVGENRNKQDCAPQPYPPQDPQGDGVQSLNVTFPTVLGQDTFVFIIGDSKGDKFISPPFSIRPPSVPLVKASDILPKPTTTPAKNDVKPAETTLANEEDVFGKPPANDGSAIAYGTALGVIVIVVVFAMFQLWRRRSKKRKAADLEAGTPISRTPSVTSSTYTYEEFKKPETEEANSLSSPLKMIRDLSSGRDSTIVRFWLPPIPRVWRFFGEEKEQSAKSAPEMTPKASESSELSYASSIHSSIPPSLRPGYGSNSGKSHSASTASSTRSSSTTSLPLQKEEEKEKEDEVDQNTRPPSPSLPKPPPRVYDPESIGEAMDKLRQREREQV